MPASAPEDHLAFSVPGCRPSPDHPPDSLEKLRLAVAFLICGHDNLDGAVVDIRRGYCATGTLARIILEGYAERQTCYPDPIPHNL
jgi:hypothetical protein